MKKLIEMYKRLIAAAKRDREKGAITVMETLIAISIGGAVLVGAFAGIPAMQESIRSSTGLNGLSQIATSVRGTFAARNNFTGLTTELAKTLAGFPPNYLEGNTVVHPWGGAVEVAVDGTNARRFTVTFEDVTESGCTSMVSSTIDLAIAIDVGGTVFNINAVDNPGTTNVDEGAAANVAALCGDDIDIAWTFGT